MPATQAAYLVNPLSTLHFEETPPRPPAATGGKYQQIRASFVVRGPSVRFGLFQLEMLVTFPSVREGPETNCRRVQPFTVATAPART